MIEKIVSALNGVILGKDEQVRLLVMALLADGHVLVEDVPGTGKTTLSKALASVIGADFARIQFTPDLLPADVTGGAVFRANTGEFEIRKGPVFTQVLLADEINRASPRTQSSLLEAMEERQVSLEGSRHALPELFMVLATENPVEFHGVFPLPEAQIDRFFIRLALGYPDFESQLEIMKETSGRVPILFLDDVLSELDRDRKNKILELTKNYQTFITCTDRDIAEDITEAEGRVRTRVNYINVESLR